MFTALTLSPVISLTFSFILSLTFEKILGALSPYSSIALRSITTFFSSISTLTPCVLVSVLDEKASVIPDKKPPLSSSTPFTSLAVIAAIFSIT